MKKPVPTEHEEQAAVIEWFDLEYPHYQGMLFAIPNGAYKGNKSRASFKNEGLRPGVPDLFLPIPIDQYHGLFIEMKRQKGSVTSGHQKDWISKLNKQNYPSRVCKGAEPAVEAIKAYLSSKLCNTCWQEHGIPECRGCSAA